MPAPSLTVRPHSRPKNADGMRIGLGDSERARGLSDGLYWLVTGCGNRVGLINNRHRTVSFRRFAASNSVAQLGERPSVSHADGRFPLAAACDAAEATFC